jgi:hypothetical protein
MKNMKRRISQFTISIFAMLLLAVAPAVALGQSVQGVTNPQLAKKVRHELVMLPYYGVFDNLAYSINGGNVTLYGQVVRPSTRSDAERRVKKIAGVTRVVNNIKVLPLSPFDDDIRRATFRSLFAGCEPVVAHRGRPRARDAGRCCCAQRRSKPGVHRS